MVKPGATVLGARLVMYPKADHTCLYCGGRIPGGQPQGDGGRGKYGRIHFCYVVRQAGQVTAYRLCPDCVIGMIMRDGVFRERACSQPRRIVSERGRAALDGIMDRLQSGEDGWDLLRQQMEDEK